MAASALVTIRGVTINGEGTMIVGLDCHVGGAAENNAGTVQADVTILPADSVQVVNTKLVQGALATLREMGHTLVARDVLIQSFQRG